MDSQADLLKNKKLARSKLGGILVFAITLGIGFFLGKALYQPKPSTVKELKPEQAVNPCEQFAVTKTNSKDGLPAPSATLEPAPKTQPPEFETPQQVIDYLSSLDSQAFRGSPLYRKMQRIFEVNPELAYGMLRILLDIPDPQLQANVSSVLNNFLIKSETNGRVIKRPAVDWVLEQIKNHNRSAEWLEILSHWGAKTRSSAEYLIEQLPLTYSEDQQEDMLYALSGANYMGSLGVSRYSIPEIEQFSSTLASYLNHDSERIRFAALQTLRAFSSSDLALKLAQAMLDDSERIRMRAMDIAVNSNRLTSELQKTILAKMENSKLREVERIYAYTLAKQLQLNEIDYNRIYKFKSGILKAINTKAEKQIKELKLHHYRYSEF